VDAGLYVDRSDSGPLSKPVVVPSTSSGPDGGAARSNKSMATSIAARALAKSTVQLVSGDRGKSGRSVATHPPWKSNSRRASSSTSRT